MLLQARALAIVGENMLEILRFLARYLGTHDRY